MKSTFLFYTIITFVFLISCTSDDDNQMGGNNPPITGGNNQTGTNFDYEIEISSPNNSDKNIDETIPIQIGFKSKTGKVVHYIEIRIFSKADSTEIYSKPSNNHIDQEGGVYDFKDNFVLSTDNGIVVNTDWILQAKVWGIDPSEVDVIKSIEFHIISH